MDNTGLNGMDSIILIHLCQKEAWPRFNGRCTRMELLHWKCTFPGTSLGFIPDLGHLNRVHRWIQGFDTAVRFVWKLSSLRCVLVACAWHDREDVEMVAFLPSATTGEAWSSFMCLMYFFVESFVKQKKKIYAVEMFVPCFHSSRVTLSLPLWRAKMSLELFHLTFCLDVCVIVAIHNTCHGSDPPWLADPQIN